MPLALPIPSLHPSDSHTHTDGRDLTELIEQPSEQDTYVCDVPDCNVEKKRLRSVRAARILLG